MLLKHVPVLTTQAVQQQPLFREIELWDASGTLELHQMDAPHAGLGQGQFGVVRICALLLGGILLSCSCARPVCLCTLAAPLCRPLCACKKRCLQETFMVKENNIPYN
jgi:hypothetical protein